MQALYPNAANTCADDLPCSLINFFLIFSFFIIIFDIPIPARLNVLVGAVQVTVISESSSDSVCRTVCFSPSIRISKCISSETIFRLFSRAILPIFFSSSFDHTLPTGLWGLHKIRSVFFSSFASFSKLSKSIVYLPPFSMSGHSTIFLSFNFIAL